MEEVKKQCQDALSQIINYYKVIDDEKAELQVKVDELSGRTTLKELDFDDLDLMDFIYKIEDQLQIQLYDTLITLNSDIDTVFHVVCDAIKKKQLA